MLLPCSVRGSEREWVMQMDELHSAGSLRGEGDGLDSWLTFCACQGSVKSRNGRSAHLFLSAVSLLSQGARRLLRSFDRRK